ncbi:MAG: DEAD/DEAH box helicase [Planctomycetes bacterium]|nr:DEAD/DEAH box helicase [Planctomycetota bacterium]
MLDLGRFSKRIVAQRELAPREARYAELPPELPPELADAVRARGFEQLYTHQAELYRRAKAGEDVVITTATASGKTLGFLLPVLEAVLEDPAARVLLLYPTKALAQDQLRGMLELADSLRAGGQPLELGVYDGDTPPDERRRIRERANLVLTNPDMLNAGLLPAHGRPGYAQIFRHVRYVVIDELHVYRGAFGAHLSNLMRRLLRVCAHYGSRPQFLASSATIANPRELAEKLCHRPFSLIDQDGSPAGGKTVYFWQPPLNENDTRRAASKELTDLLPQVLRQRHKTIAFCRSRKETEIVLKEARDHLQQVDGRHDESDLLAAYRGGYTPEERRKVEQDLLTGRLLGVVSTNALELGVDIGQLELVIQAGFPGSRASFWQQLGRAGRRGDQAYGILILATRPTDQFLAKHPDWLLDQEAEHAVVDPDNLTVQLAHVRAAAAELPLGLDDAATFPDLGEIACVLEEAGELRETYGSWHWCGPAFPAGEFSLRNTDGDRFKVVDRRDERVLCEMTRPQVYREAHPRAVYLHGGLEYMVEELDLVGNRALVVPVDQNYYTQPDVRTHIQVLVTQERQPDVQGAAWLGDVRVDDTVVGYKMLEFHNHQNLGYEQLHQALTTQLETEALWIAVPEDVLAALGEQSTDALTGVTHALRASAQRLTMAEGSDLLGTSFRYPDEGAGLTRTSIVLYDNHPGGIGFAVKAFELLPRVLRDALRLVEDCPCRDGCPACVGDYHLSRRTIAWALANLDRPEPEPAAPPAPRIPWIECARRWSEVLEGLPHGPGSAFLRLAAAARVTPGKLVLELPSPELARWVALEHAQDQLRRALAQRVELPGELKLVGEASPEGAAASAQARLKLRRRYEDLVGDPPTDAREATAELAAGVVLEAER